MASPVVLCLCKLASNTINWTGVRSDVLLLYLVAEWHGWCYYPQTTLNTQGQASFSTVTNLFNLSTSVFKNIHPRKWENINETKYWLPYNCISSRKKQKPKMIGPKNASALIIKERSVNDIYLGYWQRHLGSIFCCQSPKLYLSPYPFSYVGRWGKEQPILEQWAAVSWM